MKSFVLFSDCIPVRGSIRSLICDLKNNNYYFIPNGLYYILKKYNGKAIDAIKKDFTPFYYSTIDEYFEFLLANNLIFFSDNPEWFPQINLQWDSPSLITNAIIDVDKYIHDFKAIILQLEELKCSHIQIRVFSHKKLEYYRSILNLLVSEKSRITHLDFIIPYDNTYSRQDFNSLIEKNSRIHSIVIYNSPSDDYYPAYKGEMGYLVYRKKEVINETSCGIINEKDFYANIKLFSEAQHHNTCLNRKLSIDRHGEIKNCPSMKQSFGNINNIKLKDAVEKPKFKKYWNISKDEIEVCKSCEFRYVCTDCRAYTERTSIKDSGHDLSKPLKCGYDPYTAKWSEWSESPLKKIANQYYGFSEDK